MTRGVKERIQMVKAMEYIARQINDESIFIDLWLSLGVADCDIDYGDLSVTDEDEESLGSYIEEENFAELMRLFLVCMERAKRSGGLYCDRVVSR